MSSELKTPSGAAIQKLAKEKFAEKQKKASKQRDYTTGTPTEKVWDNYQLTKDLKRQFKELCKDKKINASSYLRACVRLLIKKDGDLKKSLSAVEKLDTENIVE